MVLVEEETLSPFRIMAVDPKGWERGNTRSSDPSGEFELSVASGTYTLVAFVKGYAPERIEGDRRGPRQGGRRRRDRIDPREVAAVAVD